MPKATKQPTPHAASMNGTTSEVFTLSEAASYLRLTESNLLELVHTQSLSARLAGSEWRFLKSAIQDWLSTGSSTPQSRKEAQLALAGKYRNDPDLLQICEEAYRKRKQKVTRKSDVRS